jgi:hypothetical protein
MVVAIVFLALLVLFALLRVVRGFRNPDVRHPHALRNYQEDAFSKPRDESDLI